jgi:hypothetical protein
MSAAPALKTGDAAPEPLDSYIFVQSWPMSGTERELTRARLEELIVKRKR